MTDDRMPSPRLRTTALLASTMLIVVACAMGGRAVGETTTTQNG